MARGRHYAKLSLSNAARLSFSDLCILLFLFLSLCRLCVCVFLCSHWSLADVPLIFFCPADHVPDWQPRVLLGMVEARSVNVKKTTTTTAQTYSCPLLQPAQTTCTVLLVLTRCDHICNLFHPKRSSLANITITIDGSKPCVCEPLTRSTVHVLLLSERRAVTRTSSSKAYHPGKYLHHRRNGTWLIK